MPHEHDAEHHAQGSEHADQPAADVRVPEERHSDLQDSVGDEEDARDDRQRREAVARLREHDNARGHAQQPEQHQEPPSEAQTRSVFVGEHSIGHGTSSRNC